MSDDPFSWPRLPTWELLPLNADEVDVLRRTRGVARSFAERAADYDRLAQFPDANIKSLYAEGLLAGPVPRRSGGGGYRLTLAAAVVEEIARGCASSAWILITQYGFMYVAPRILGNGAQRIYEEVVRHGVTVAGSTNVSNVEATQVDGGYRVSGRARFCSGGVAARWLSIPISLPGGETSGGAGIPRVLWFDRDREGVSVPDAWDAMSLRATASSDVVLDDVFVRDGEVHALGAPVSTPRYEDSYPGLWPALFLQNFVFLGIAQFALDWACAFVGQRRDRAHRSRGSAPGTLADVSWVRDSLAEAAAALVACRALAYDALRCLEAGDTAAGGGSLVFAATPGIVTDATTKVVTNAFRVVGGEAVLRRNPLERALRDIQVAAVVDGNHPARAREAMAALLFPAPSEPRTAQ